MGKNLNNINNNSKVRGTSKKLTSPLSELFLKEHEFFVPQSKRALAKALKKKKKRK